MQNGASDPAGWWQVGAALGALITALASLKFSRDALALQRKHNYQTLRPVPYLQLGNFESGLNISLVNEGMGPLFISKIRILNAAEKGERENFVDLIALESESIRWDRYAKQSAGRVVGVGDELILLKLVDDDYKAGDLANTFAKEIRTVREQLKGMRFTLSYSDIYGNRYDDYTRELSWMAAENVGSPQDLSTTKK